MANVFLLYRPFHFDFCSRIIAQQNLSDCVFVNHYEAEPIFYQNARIINFNSGVWHKIRQTREVRIMLNEMVSRELTTVYIPHTLGLLANFAYYQLKRKYPNLNIAVYYEGVIIFYKYEHPFLKHIRHYLSRILVGWLCGIWFRPKKQLLDLDDPTISKIYSPFAGINGGLEKLVIVPLAKIEFIPNPATCVIIGLRLERNLENESRRVIAHIFDYIIQKGYSRVLFKDHPAEPNMQFSEIAAEKGIKIEEVKERIPIEKLVQNLQPSEIISIWSSALINLRGMLPLQVEISSFVSDRLLQFPEHRKIVQKFEEEGINVHFV